MTAIFHPYFPKHSALDQSTNLLIHTKKLETSNLNFMNENRQTTDQLSAALREITDLKLQNENLRKQLQGLKQTQQFNESNLLSTQIETNRQASHYQKENQALTIEIRNYTEQLRAADEKIRNLTSKLPTMDQTMRITHLQAELIVKQQTIEKQNNEIQFLKRQSAESQQQLANTGNQFQQQAAQMTQKVQFLQSELQSTKIGQVNMEKLTKEIEAVKIENQKSNETVSQVQQLNLKLQAQSAEKESEIKRLFQEIVELKENAAKVEQQISNEKQLASKALDEKESLKHELEVQQQQLQETQQAHREQEIAWNSQMVQLQQHNDAEANNLTMQANESRIQLAKYLNDTLELSSCLLDFSRQRRDIVRKNEMRERVLLNSVQITKRITSVNQVSFALSDKLV